MEKAIELIDVRKHFNGTHAVRGVSFEVLSGEALARLSGLIDDKAMQLLNFEADQKKREVAEVVREFLKGKGL